MNSSDNQTNRAVAFQFYPDKWQSHTRRLSDAAYRVYFEMLCWMWQHSSDHYSIDNDPDAIACKLAMQPDAIASALREIQNPHAPLLKSSGKKLFSNGLKKEREKQLLRSNLRRESAKKRWDKHLDNKQEQCLSNANASVLQCLPTPTPIPSPIPIPTPSNTKKERVEVDEPEDFKRFYAAYPRKIARAAALRAWKKAKGKPGIDAIIAAIDAQKQSEQWQKDNGQYIPHPQTWINQGRWDDDTQTQITAKKYFEEG